MIFWGLSHPELFYELGVHQDLQVFCKAASQLDCPQYIMVPGVVPAQVQDLALLSVELHQVPLKPFLQPAEAPLDNPLVYQPMGCLSTYCQLPPFLNYSEQWSHEQPIRSLGRSTAEHCSKTCRALDQVYQGTAKLSSFVSKRTTAAPGKVKGANGDPGN